jgi:magnesium transporter
MGKVDEVSVGGVTWVNIEAPAHKDIEFLTERFSFTHLQLEDCLSKRQLQKIEPHPDHLFAILHFPCVSPHSEIVTSTQVSVFLGEKYIVTVHQGILSQIGEMFDAVRANKTIKKASPGFFLYRILDRLVDNIFPMLESIMKRLDDIEERVFDEKIEVVRELTTLRRNIASLRRTILPLRRIIAGLYDEVQSHTPELAPHFRDVNDHVEKAYATLDEAREMVEIFKDTDFTVSTEHSNKILAVLTILFTLSIPGTLIGTFYGMNIPLPGGVETGPWTLFGRYTTLITIIIVSLVPTVIMVWYFKRLGWM